MRGYNKDPGMVMHAEGKYMQAPQLDNSNIYFPLYKIY